jgi:hypothetical protein
MFSCSDNPTGPGNRAAMTGSGDIDPEAGGQFLLSAVDMGPGWWGNVEVWAYDLTVESDSVVAFDLVLVNGTDRIMGPPIQFVVTSIVPNTVTVLNPDGYYRDREPFFDFSDNIGEDNLLTPGEATTRVHARFVWPAPTAFSIGFRLVINEEQPVGGTIAGVVFQDVNENGVYDGDIETGIAGVPVELVAAWGDSDQTTVGIVTQTDPWGRYEFGTLSAGVYRITVLVDPWARLTTPNPLLVTLVELPDGTVSSFLDAHFGVGGLIPPRPQPVFGPVPVGPGSSMGTRVDSTFVIPPPMPPFPPEGNVYYLRVEPPAIMGPYPMWIDEVKVFIDGQGVYKFDCPTDSLCFPPADRLALDPALTGEGEHAISIEVLGSELSYVLVSVEHEPWWDIKADRKRP